MEGVEESFTCYPDFQTYTLPYKCRTTSVTNELQTRMYCRGKHIPSHSTNYPNPGPLAKLAAAVSVPTELQCHER